MLNPEISVTTVNAHEGRLIRSGDLARFADVDVLLLQETHPDRDDLAATLEEETDLRLAVGSGAMRMAIAVNKDIDIKDKYEMPVQSAGAVVNGLRSVLGPDSRAIRRFRDRGFLGVLIDFNGGDLTVLGTHMIVAARPRKRQDHLKQTPEILSRFAGSLIMAGDMNHWPAPQRVDFRMQEHANLSRAPLNQSTWTHGQSGLKHQIVGGALARVGVDIDAEMDAIFWRDNGLLQLKGVKIEPVQSDHKAVTATFSRTRS